MLLHAKLLNLKTFKDFLFMQNQRYLEGTNFFKDLIKNCDMMSLFLKTFHGLHIFKDFNSLESTGDNGRQPPLLPPRPRATRVDTRIHNYRLSAAP